MADGMTWPVLSNLIQHVQLFQIVRHQEQPLRCPDDLQRYLRLPGDTRLLELGGRSRKSGSGQDKLP